MARGKAKLKKGQRTSAKSSVQPPPKISKSATAAAETTTNKAKQTTSDVTSKSTKKLVAHQDGNELSDEELDSPRHYQRGLGEISDVFSNAYDSGYGSHDGDGYSENCDHSDLDPTKMKKVAGLLSDLFTSSFRLAVPSLFRGMIQNLQDQVLLDKLMGFLDDGFEPTLIRNMAKDDSTRDGIKMQIKLACDDELPDVVLKLSTEDCFDLACDLAVRHGRDLQTWGPPCACSFSSCLGCLEKLVVSVRNTPPVPPAAVRPIDGQQLISAIEETLNNDDGSDFEASPVRGLVTKGSDVASMPWVTTMKEAWTSMADILWQTADEIDPLNIPKVKEAYDALTKLDGLDLWYTIVTRELEATCHLHGDGASSHAHNLDKNRILRPEKSGKTSSAPSGRGSTLALSMQYERMKKENMKMRNDKGLPADQVDDVGIFYRKSLARAIREQGNSSFARNEFQEAAEHYTRAMGYDAEEPVFPLNRAACLVKLARFGEAEKDCSMAIELDKTNHKAWFRRGVSRAGQGKVGLARKDFEEVLKMQRNAAGAFDELRSLSMQFLEEAHRKTAKDSQAKAEVKCKELPTREEIAGKSKVVYHDTENRTEAEDKDASKMKTRMERSDSQVSAVSDGNTSSSSFISAKAPQKDAGLVDDDLRAQLQAYEEVLSQTSFALAFSMVVKQRTGFDVHVPIPAWIRPPSSHPS